MCHLEPTDAERATGSHLKRLVPILRTDPAIRGYLMVWTCWGKPDMVRYGPDDASLLFVFDSPEDDGIARYWRKRVLDMYGYHFLPPIVNEGPEWYENGSHAAALTFFGLRGQFREHLVGVSGNEPCYRRPGSAMSTRTLRNGEFCPRPLINRGPVVYPHHVIDEVGTIDLGNFPMWYGEADYSARAHKAGFVNGVLGVDCVHETFGAALASRTYEGQEAKDMDRFLALHSDVPLGP